MNKFTSKITAKSIEQSGLPNDYKKVLAEYIWNAFDAKATEVRLDYTSNELGYLSSLSISDDGTGIDATTIDETFGNFLDSKKRDPFNRDTLQKGRKGKGRYAFSTLSDTCSWLTTFIGPEEKILKYKITIHKEDLQNFVTDEMKIIKKGKTGTVVNFSNIFNLSEKSLTAKEFEEYLCSEFGWFMFLNRDRNCKILINSVELEYQNIIDDSEELTLEFGDDKFNVVFLRWNQKIGDKYYFYFMNHGHKEAVKKHTLLNNKAIDFHHSVYIKSSFFSNFNETVDENPVFDFAGKNQSHPTFKALLKSLDNLVREKEKHYIRDVQALRLIQEFNDKGILPNDQIKSEDLESVLMELYCAEPRLFQSSNLHQSKMTVGLLNLLLVTNQNEHILDLIESITELTEEEKENIDKVL